VVKQHPARHHGDECGVQERLHDVALRRRHLVQPEAGFELLESHLDEPPCRVGPGYVIGAELLHRNVGDVEVIGTRVFIPQSHQPKACPGRPATPRVLTPFEAQLYLQIDGLPAQTFDHILKSAANDVDRPPAPLSMNRRDERIRLVFEAREEVTALPLNAREELKPVVTQVEDQELVLHPSASPQHRTIVNTFRRSPSPTLDHDQSRSG